MRLKLISIFSLIIAIMAFILTCSWNNPYRPEKFIATESPARSPITISNIQLITSDPTSCTFTWDTNINCTTNMNYGLTTAYGSTNLPLDSSPDNTSHQLKISGLTRGATYHFQIFAEDANAHTRNSVDLIAQACDCGAGVWFFCLQEDVTNPVVDETSERQYYASVLYDVNAFGNTIGQDIDGAGGGTDTYTVLPYYKMWVGDEQPLSSGVYHTDFSYSADGINWIRPIIGENIISGHYHSSVAYNIGGFSGYRMWNPRIAWNYVDYYTSTNGINWAIDASGEISQTVNVEPDLPFSAFYGLSNVLYEGGTFYAWANTNGHWNMISSADAKTWTNLGECILDISTMAGNQFNTDGSVSVIHKNGIYELWYTSDVNGDFAGNRRSGISYAEATDGINFVAVNNLDYIGINGTPAGPKKNAILKITDGYAWRNSVTYTPWVIFDANKFSGHGELKHYKMYFNGDSTDTATYPARSTGYISFDESVDLPVHY
jgi:hypothetical protein